jgi:hypothetical protein
MLFDFLWIRDVEMVQVGRMVFRISIALVLADIH